MKKNILATIALVGALCWTGCQKDLTIDGDPNGGELSQTDSVWTLTLHAVKNDGTLTKGLAIGDGDTEAATTVLKSIWKAGDKVHVFLGERYVGELTAAPDEQDPHFATLWGMVTTAGIKPGVSSLTLLTPRREWDYTGQNGKLLAIDDPENSIESKYHYTMASNVPVTAATAGFITTETATFTNQQSIYRMNFRFQNDGGNDKVAVNAKTVTISGAGTHLVQHYDLEGLSMKREGDITVSLSEATTDPFFVAICNEYAHGNEEVLTFTVIDDDGATYKGSKTIPGEYNNNGSFVSMKNTTLNYRLEMNLNSSSVDTVL